uniref:Beta-mannosidase n=1 Tax=Arion vulgaris TaxID=1028688 RepID=A0A0B6ZR31_9EUPU
MKHSAVFASAVIFAAGLLYVQAFVRVDLGGDGWIVTSNQTNTPVPGKVPGSMYTALIDQGLIGDPLFRDNDDNYVWVGDADWTYSRNFSVSSDVASSKQVWLICEGLDTVATVLVNDKVVGQSENMFARSTFNVAGVVKGGANTLVIHFTSAVREALARTKNSDYDIPRICPSSAENGQCHVNQIRKEQCSFSWDWGPSFPTQGIWKPIYIDAYSNAVIRDVSALVKKVNSQWQVDVDVYFDVDNVAEVKGQLNANIASLNLSLSQELSVSPANSSIKISLLVPTTTHVPLWWPNGYGDQPLFDLDVAFTSGVDTTTKSVRIGFRTVELVQDPVSNKPEQGLSFYFRINGIPIFLKGSNWIPADSFQERITVEKLRFLLESAANVSINSLRVWGGGVYESEEFYQLCDELGIMVWQDLMFSVSLYPTYPAFLSLVTTEITQQVRRLKSHTSIIIWAGNNENESALRQNWFHITDNYTRYYNDYVQLYVKTIKPIVTQEDSTREYLTSSPSNGKETEKEGYVSNDTSSELYGDIHFYDYSVDQWKATSFRIPRMASEYGVQSWCNNESLSNVFNPLDFSITSDMVNHRQHHTNGNTEMADEVKVHLNLPNSPDANVNFADFIYLTQINQAMCMRTQSEHYRRYQARLLADGRGLTMGALYWQLNDIWQAPTWASIDYEGSWKMLHYYARTFFNRTLISPYLLDADTLDVYIVLDGVPVTEVRNPADGTLSFKLSDNSTDLIKGGLSISEASEKLKAISGVSSGSLRVETYDYSSFQALHSETVTYNLKTAAESVYTKKISDLLSDSGCASVENCLLYLTATDNSGSLVSSTWYTLAYPKSSKLQQANVKIASVTSIDPYTFNIQVTTDAIALFVWLSLDNIKGQFSDNGFLLLTPSVQVQFHARQIVTADVLMSQLKIRSLVDVKTDVPIVG